MPSSTWNVADKTAYDGLVEFIAIDMTALTGDVYRFVNTSNFNLDDPDQETITWGGYTWKCLPFETSSWKLGGTEAARPRIVLPDVNGLIFVIMRQNGGCVGCAVERYKVLDPKPTGTQPHRFEQYLINTWTGTGKSVNLDLATHFDLAKSKLPGYKMARKDFPGLGSALLR